MASRLHQTPYCLNLLYPQHHHSSFVAATHSFES
jgi:hypothetical protein